MKDLAGTFLTQADREKITETVRDVEKETSGEIVPMVVSASYHYPMANVVGGVAAALPLALILTPIIGGYFWAGSQNMWIFIGLFAVLFVIFHELVKRVYGLKRFFISKREIEEEVEEAAINSFFKEGLYRTRDETGVLIFISIFEHKVWVLADRGINSKVDKTQWDDIVSGIVAGIKTGRQADAICEAVVKAGDLLKTHFPVKKDDTDELTNLIVREE